MSSASFGAAWAPSATTIAPASWATPAISASGFSVPRTLETWAIASSFGPRSSRPRSASRSSSPVVVDRRPVDLRADPLGQLLPGHEVRVVLHLGEHDAVAGADVGVAPGAGDQVERLGRVADEDDLAAVGGAEVAGDGRRARPRRRRSPRRRGCGSRGGRWSGGGARSRSTAWIEASTRCAQAPLSR